MNTPAPRESATSTAHVPGPELFRPGSRAPSAEPARLTATAAEQPRTIEWTPRTRPDRQL